MKVKTVALLFTILASASLVFAVRLGGSEPSTWTVDDDGPANFASIQEAVNSPQVADGDTIFVHSGTYYESVIVSKSLTIIGENRSTNLVGNGTSIGFQVLCPHDEYDRALKVSGFTIKNHSVGIWSEGNGHGSSSSFEAIDNSFIGNGVGALIEWYGGGSIVENTFLDNTKGIVVGGRIHGGNISGNILLSSHESAIQTGIESYGTISNNYVVGNRYGAFSRGGDEGVIYCNNTFQGNDFGVYSPGYYEWEFGPTFVHNNFVNNIQQTFAENSYLDWDLAYPSGGNYWSDYSGEDSFSGQYQDMPGSDGFGDTPYIINTNNTDNYPFVEPISIPLPSLPPLHPVARFTFSPVAPVVNETVTFDAANSRDLDGQIVSYQWDFGDGNTTVGSSETISHSYTSVGSYNVALTVVDNDGLNSTETKMIAAGKMSSTISILTTPAVITVGQNTLISGLITPARPGVTVTILADNLILTTVTTDENSQYQYDWTPAEVGTYDVEASWDGDENTFPGETSTTLICLKIATTISLSTSCTSTLVGFKVSIAGALSDEYGNSLKDETIVLFYTFSGIGTWIPITSDATDSNGNYSAVWVPPATGYFTLKAEWAGNATHAGASSNTTLSSLAYEDQYVFSVESNSTLSDLAFSTNGWKLQFDATGPEATIGYVRVTVAKGLVADPANIKVKVDDKVIEFSIASLDDSWLLTFYYKHSTHRVAVELASQITPEFPIAIIILLLMVPMVFAFMFIERRRKARSKHSQSARTKPSLFLDLH